jgi:hypothetical protein
MSQYTAEALAGAFPLRELREVQVKGRARAVRTFTVESAGPAGETGPPAGAGTPEA